MRTLIVWLTLIGIALAQNWPEAQTSLRLSRVVFLGESHRSSSDHRGQLSVLQDLARLDDRPLVVAVEMFTSVGDEALAEWLTSDQRDIPKPLWEKEWGHPYPLYAPIFQWLKREGVTTVSLRPDPALASKLKKEGPASVLPQIDELLLGPGDYYQHMRGVVADHMPPGQEPPQEMVDQFFLVQCFWDEYMAWRIQTLLEQHPDARIAVLVGHGHLHPRRGIPWRLSRRSPGTSWLNVGFSDEQAGIADLIFSPRP